MGPGVESVVVLLNCKFETELDGPEARELISSPACIFYSVAGKSKRPSASLSSKVGINFPSSLSLSRVQLSVAHLVTSFVSFEQILQMMTHHYPYRVGAAHIHNTPFVLNAFLSLVWPFIDPQTKHRIDTKGKVVELGHVDRETLMTDFGGDLEVSPSISSTLEVAAKPRRSCSGEKEDSNLTRRLVPFPPSVRVQARRVLPLPRSTRCFQAGWSHAEVEITRWQRRHQRVGRQELGRRGSSAHRERD